MPSATRSSQCSRSGSARAGRTSRRAASARLTRDGEQEGDADGGRAGRGRRVVLPVGVDHRDRRRQARLGDVVVDHDDVEPGRGAAASGSCAVMPQSTVTTS